MSLLAQIFEVLKKVVDLRRRRAISASRLIVTPANVVGNGAVLFLVC